MKPIPSYIKDHLEYREGKFFCIKPYSTKINKIKINKINVGDEVGFYNKLTKVYYISFKGIQLTRARMVWWWFTGSLPEKPMVLMHVSRDATDDRLENLHSVDHSELPSLVHKTKSSTGYRYIYVSSEKYNTYFLSLHRKGKTFYLGTSKDINELIKLRDSIMTKKEKSRLARAEGVK